ncbi:MAG TPA: hypothetical protein VFV78_06110 [Vicinamibacterales bacterium]|nr:hypothetical protein [Vicinamibacterales bacterium]
MPADSSIAARHLLRHTVATLAYRAEKVLKDAPDAFVDHRLAAGSRTPIEIVAHMGDLVEWAERMARGEYRWAPQSVSSWTEGCDRFFKGLLALDAAIDGSALEPYSAETIFQGPIADALTHVGQLALIRGTVGVPIRPESYARAEILVGRVGTEQSSQRKEFDGDASRS